MKKLWACFFMVSLLFICSFSYAYIVDFTVTDTSGKVVTYHNENAWTNSYTGTTATTNYTLSADLRDYPWVSNYSDYILIRRGLNFEFLFFNLEDGLKFYYDDCAFVTSTQSGKFLSPFLNGQQYGSGENRLTGGRLIFKSNKPTDISSYPDNFKQFWVGTVYYTSQGSNDDRFHDFEIIASSVDIYSADFYNVTASSGAISSATFTLHNDIIFSSGNGSDIKMENPLTDEEVKNILEIFLESVRNSDLPEHYGKYFLVYNKRTNKYLGYVYPSYIDLKMTYYDFDEDDNIIDVFNSVGPNYKIGIYYEDDSYFDALLNSFSAGISSLFGKTYNIYEFRSNNSNTSFHFANMYDLVKNIGFSTTDEPIIYTSHKIYSLFLIDRDDVLGLGNYELNEDSSINKKVFIDSETGLPIDDIINEYTDENVKDVNILSFIGLLFGLIFSIIKFLIKFFDFVIKLFIVPASTSILPDGFIVGIDWLKEFKFGEILLYDIFSIVFVILLSIYIVRLIKDAH